MIRLESDYLEGAHPLIIEHLTETNMEQTPGYGTDAHCQNASNLIRSACYAPEADVHFLVGGTQTNAVVITSVLRPHQGVICAETGHINVHETGAIEARGHKVLPIPSQDGKLSAAAVRACYDAHYSDNDREHIVQPGMVYISHPTENGTTYTAKELEELSCLCRELSLPLYLDGARLSYGLAAPVNDLSLEMIARLCDIFYIGGTKTGALFGEALVITSPSLKKDFRYLIKQQGAMLAKGRLLGIQFETLFTDELYIQIARHAVNLAMDIKKTFQEKGIALYYDSCTNQQFPVLNKQQIKVLAETYSFSHWKDLPDDKTVIRLCTSWATDPEYVRQLCRDIREKL